MRVLASVVGAFLIGSLSYASLDYVVTSVKYISKKGDEVVVERDGKRLTIPANRIQNPKQAITGSMVDAKFFPKEIGIETK